jgi:diguanylate cyclase (GGDEF)-like protein
MPLTVSVGIAMADDETRDWEHLVSLADNAMYEAKRAGKDRIAIHTEPGVALESYVR